MIENVLSNLQGQKGKAGRDGKKGKTGPQGPPGPPGTVAGAAPTLAPAPLRVRGPAGDVSIFHFPREQSLQSLFPCNFFK